MEKKQLNYILEEYFANPNEINFLVLRLNSFNYGWKVMVPMFYQFSIPTLSRRISKDSKQFVDGLSMLRAFVLELAFVCADNQKRLGKMKALTNASQLNQRTVWNRSLWSPPLPPPKDIVTNSS